MVTLGEMNQRMGELNGWNLQGNSIVKNYSFKDFKESLEFVNKIGEVAEKFGHHPDIIINYNQVKLSLTTHAQEGLTEKDFELAKEIDKI